MSYESVDHEARAEILAHKLRCDAVYEAYKENFERNERDHRDIIDSVKRQSDILQGIRDDLHRYDLRAIVRWISFGSALILLIGSALLKSMGVL